MQQHFNTTITNCFKHTSFLEEKNQEIEKSPEEQELKQEFASAINQPSINHRMSIHALLNLEEEQQIAHEKIPDEDLIAIALSQDYHEDKVEEDMDNDPFGGIMLGPSALGRNKDFMRWVFPSWSTPILESVATIKMSDRTGHAENFVFIGVSLSITAFPVLARILAELKLLTTRIGETAMAAAALNDLAAWILLALAVALAGGTHSPLVSIWVLLSGLAFVGFMLLIVRPVMKWVGMKYSSDHNIVDEGYICLTLAAAMVFGFMTDLIGIHAIFGAFIFGLIIPRKGELAGRLIKRIEDFVFGLLLPLYFASNGLKTDVGKIQGVAAWGLLALVISTACAGKILGTFVVALLCTFPVRESLALGLLMNTKGLVELVVLNIGREKKVLNDEMFTILVIMALFTTFMTTPTVMAIYKPEHHPVVGVNLGINR
ncbi:Cation/H(+) antiporter 20 [Forsythia ovata]|uniref:Cation/H(+) antiporter 20 n=1 Tax=Forsythia ovata TaxID=205694 RepID=A0ABD1X158_9LAMI